MGADLDDVLRSCEQFLVFDDDDRVHAATSPERAWETAAGA